MLPFELLNVDLEHDRDSTSPIEQSLRELDRVWIATETSPVACKDFTRYPEESHTCNRERHAKDHRF